MLLKTFENKKKELYQKYCETEFEAHKIKSHKKES